MTKSEFLELFVNNANAIHIRMALNYDAFLKNTTIKISEETTTYSALLNFYVPKFEKHGNLDTQHYNQQALDPEVLPLTIRQVMLNPAKWDLAIPGDERPDIKQLWSVPIATDKKSGRTLLLDSNHTIVSSLHELDQDLLDTMSLSVAHVSGVNLEDFIPDFRILNRGS